MRFAAFIALLLLAPGLSAGPVTIALDAPGYGDKAVVLYRYMDPFTLRLERIAQGHTDATGHAVITADVEGTVRAQLRINEVSADLYLRPGQYHATMPLPGKDEVRTISGATKVNLTFPGLSRMDVNALVGDLNMRLDAFLAEDLATDPNSGMDAVAKARNRQGRMEPDSAKGRPDLFISPRWNEARVDTFARKLHKFYAGVEDPWFQSDVEYGLAGLRLGPRTDDRALFNRFLKDRPVLYNVPEYARFLSNFFADFLLRFPFRTNTVQFQREIKNASTDSLKALLARNDFLKDDRLCELVLITGLYAQEANKELDRAGILSILGQIKEKSAYAEHRLIAANMLWDLTAMSVGMKIPAVDLLDTAGNALPLDKLLDGRTCLMLTRPGNSFGGQELAAMAQLQVEYGNVVHFICIALDRSPMELAAWLRTQPKFNWPWYAPVEQQRLLDDLRIRNAPVLFMLDGNLLTASPGPLPSQGLVNLLHAIRAKDAEDRKLKPDRGVPAPRH